MEKHTYEQVQHQLSDSEDIEVVQFTDQVHHHKSIFRRVLGVTYRISLVCLLVYIAVLLTSYKTSQNESCSCQTVSNVVESKRKPTVVPQERVKYVERPEWESLRHPWNLQPSPELEKVWNRLLYALNVRITPDELASINENSTNRVQVEDGDYAGVIGVYHHMHCLNNLRRVVHWDYYGPLLAKTKGFNPEGYTKEHSNHCIDSIRQALMCHANTDIYTVEWVDDELFPVAPDLRSSSVTKCVNWDLLDSWARQRALIPGRFRTLPGPFASHAPGEQDDLD